MIKWMCGGAKAKEDKPQNERTVRVATSLVTKKEDGDGLDMWT